MKEILSLIIPVILVVSVLRLLELTLVDKTKRFFDSYFNKNSKKINAVFIDPRKN